MNVIVKIFFINIIKIKNNRIYQLHAQEVGVELPENTIRFSVCNPLHRVSVLVSSSTLMQPKERSAISPPKNEKTA